MKNYKEGVKKMEIKDWIKIVYSTMKLPIYTGGLNVRVKCNQEHTKFILFTEKVCEKCKQVMKQKVGVEFYNEAKLSVFEAELLYALFCLKRVPRDYAGYHKCPAGKCFVENIKEVRRDGTSV